MTQLMNGSINGSVDDSVTEVHRMTIPLPRRNTTATETDERFEKTLLVKFVGTEGSTDWHVCVDIFYKGPYFFVKRFDEDETDDKMEWELKFSTYLREELRWA